jgi:hypothetical protein
MLLGKFNKDEYDHLFGNKTAGPKCHALRIFAARAESNKTLKVNDAVEAILSCISERNLITHGLWGWELADEAKPCSYSPAKNKFFYLSELFGFHERLCAAAKKVDDAFYDVFVGKPAPDTRNRRQMFGDGPPPDGPTPTVIER